MKGAMKRILRFRHLGDWALWVGWMALIFWFSSQPEVLGPGEKDSLIRDVFNYGAHAAIFGVLAFLGWRLTFGGAPGLPAWVRRSPHLCAGLWATLYAVSDEFHQHFVPGRTCSVWDLAVDLLGVWGALALLALGASRHAGVRRFLLRPLEALRR